MNEQETIASVVSCVVSLGHTVIVVDDGSHDNTVINAKTAGAIVLKNIQNLGAWKATQTGIRYAARLNFKAVITMDADGQHDPKHVPLLVSEYLKGADVVIGQCIERGSFMRHLAWFSFRYFNHLGIQDITSGFRLYNHKAISCLISKQATMLEYQCVGVLLMLRNMHLNIVEKAVPMKKREKGISRIFHSWSAVAYYLLYSSLLSVTKAFPTKKERYIKRVVRTKDYD